MDCVDFYKKHFTMEFEEARAELNPFLERYFNLKGIQDIHIYVENGFVIADIKGINLRAVSDNAANKS